MSKILFVNQFVIFVCKSQNKNRKWDDVRKIVEMQRDLWEYFEQILMIDTGAQIRAAKGDSPILTSGVTSNMRRMPERKIENN